MSYILFFKPIVDMLYQYQVLDVILTLLCILALVKGRKVKGFCWMDAVLSLWALFFLFAFLRHPYPESTTVLVKIMSMFLLYILGRLYYYKWPKLVKYLTYGLTITLIVSLITAITGIGFQYWGAIYTFMGLYYFKTDAAAALSQCLIFYLIRKDFSIKQLIIILIGLSLIALANARIYYLISFLIIILHFLYARECRTGKRILISFKLITIVVMSIVFIIFALNELSSDLGEDYLLIQFDDVDELYDNKNTQGRNVIWEIMLNRFFHEDITTQIVGLHLTADSAIDSHNAHSLYIFLLISTGYLGIAIFVLFLFTVTVYINKIKTAKLFYCNICFMMQLLIAGISCSVLICTQLTWLPFFFLGLGVSDSQHNSKTRSLPSRIPA